MNEIPEPVTKFTNTIVGLVQDAENYESVRDLSLRQLSILLITYTTQEPQTVRGLAAKLRVNKPAITRGLDRLTEYELIRRKEDPADRRSVLVARTPTGGAYMRKVARMLIKPSNVPSVAIPKSRPDSVVVEESVGATA
jgi:DNA-binding MarR family transcriptional regulator